VSDSETIEANVDRVLSLLEARGLYGVVQRDQSEHGSVYIDVVSLATLKQAFFIIRVSDHGTHRNVTSVDPTALTPEQAVKEVVRVLAERRERRRVERRNANMREDNYGRRRL
jgi:hypothetical protein